MIATEPKPTILLAPSIAARPLTEEERGQLTHPDRHIGVAYAENMVVLVGRPADHNLLPELRFGWNLSLAATATPFSVENVFHDWLVADRDGIMDILPDPPAEHRLRVVADKLEKTAARLADVSTVGEMLGAFRQHCARNEQGAA